MIHSRVPSEDAAKAVAADITKADACAEPLVRKSKVYGPLYSWGVFVKRGCPLTASRKMPKPVAGAAPAPAPAAAPAKESKP